MGQAETDRLVNVFETRINLTPMLQGKYPRDKAVAVSHWERRNTVLA
jgi:hypothetical protein